MNRETKLDIHNIFVLIIMTGKQSGVTVLFHCKNPLQVDIGKAARERGKSCCPR
jgi:hypothetical protein